MSEKFKALVVNQELLESAIIAKSQRLENKDENIPVDYDFSSINLKMVKLKSLCLQTLSLEEVS